MTSKARARELRRHLVVTLHREGLSCRVIARVLGLTYRAVKTLLDTYAGAGLLPSRASLVSAPTIGSPEEDTTT
jgi:transposase